MTTVVERFLKYVSYDTQSDEAYDTCPSTEKQLLLANELKRELEEMGASDVRMSEYGYLFARIPDTAYYCFPFSFSAHPPFSPSAAFLPVSHFPQYEAHIVAILKDMLGKPLHTEPRLQEISVFHKSGQ